MESNIKMHRYTDKKVYLKILASIIQIIILGYTVIEKQIQTLGKKVLLIFQIAQQI